MKSLFLKSFLLLLPLVVGAVGDNILEAERLVQVYDYTDSEPRRPFSWYYPYSYQYYYPRHHLDDVHSSHYNRGSSCYWIYTNQGYIYQCN